MKKKLTFLMFVLVSLALTACVKTGYYEKNGKLMYQYPGNRSDEFLAVVTEVDIKTFKPYGRYSQFGRDHFSVFGYASRLPELDVETFKIKRRQSNSIYYAEDKNGAYKIRCKFTFCTVFPMEGLDFESIKTVDRSKYSMDTDSVFYDSTVVPGADPQTFEVINYSSTNYELEFARDKNQVYHKEKIISKAHPKTFKVISTDYTKDDQYVFYNEQVVNGADPDSFEVLNEFYGKDKDHAFLEEKMIKNSRSDSFEVLNDYYSKDDQYVYYKGRVVSMADPETFHLFVKPEEEYSSWCANDGQDKNYVFSRGELDEYHSKIDWEKMKAINEMNNYYSDGKHIYWSHSPCFFRIVEEADLETFQSNHPRFGFDKKFAYYDYVTIPNLSPDGFVALDLNFVKNNEKALCRIAHDRPFAEVEADLNSLKLNEEAGLVEDESGSFLNCGRK